MLSGIMNLNQRAFIVKTQSDWRLTAFSSSTPARNKKIRVMSVGSHVKHEASFEKVTINIDSES